MIVSTGHLKVIVYVLWGLSTILVAVLVWRTIAYAGRLSAYIEFVQSGVAVQGTVLGRRSAEKTSQYNPHRYAITYGFWVGKRRVIRIEGVSQQTYEAQYVDDPVTIIYLPSEPQISIIESELLLPWPVEPGIVLALCVVSLAIVHRTTKRVKARQAEEAPTPVPSA